MIAGIAAAFIDPLLVNDGFWDSDSNSLAGATGLEPAASCVTGRRSSQLNYAPAISTSYPYRAFLSVPVNSRNFLRMP
jgi:hypothetical protein